MPTVTMSRERRLLLDILLKECERIFPQCPSKAGLQRTLESGEREVALRPMAYGHTQFLEK